MTDKVDSMIHNLDSGLLSVSDRPLIVRKPDEALISLSPVTYYLNFDGPSNDHTRLRWCSDMQDVKLGYDGHNNLCSMVISPIDNSPSADFQEYNAYD